LPSGTQNHEELQGISQGHVGEALPEEIRAGQSSIDVHDQGVPRRRRPLPGGGVLLEQSSHAHTSGSIICSPSTEFRPCGRDKHLISDHHLPPPEADAAFEAAE
jgi:hypothetical protein